MKTTAFIEKAKKNIMYANILEKGEHELYTKPSFIWTSMPIMRFLLKCNIVFDETEFIIKNHAQDDTFLVLDIQELNHMMIKPVLRNSNIFFPEHHIELFIKTDQVDLQIETKDHISVLKICKILHDKQLSFEDPCGILKILIAYAKDDYNYYDYMQKHYSEIAKQYGLDCPRVYVVRDK